MTTSASDQRPLVFISYRRADTEAIAEAIRIHLETALPSVRVFMDTRHVRKGERWDNAIEQALQQASVVLALVGPTWATLERAGKPRIQLPDDWVAREIAVGLDPERRLLPVTYTPGGMAETKLPEQASLPKEIAGLALLEPFSVRAGHIEHDVAPLIAALRETLGIQKAADSVLEQPPPHASGRWRYLAPAAVLSACGVGVWWWSQQEPEPNPQALSIPSHALRAGEEFGMAALVDFLGSEDSDGARQLANRTCMDSIPHLEALGIDTEGLCANQANLLVALPNTEHAMLQKCPPKAVLAFKAGRCLGTLQLAAILASDGEPSAVSNYRSLYGNLAEPTDRILESLDVHARLGEVGDPHQGVQNIEQILTTLGEVWVGEPRPPCRASNDPAAGFEIGYVAAGSLVLRNVAKATLTDEMLTTLIEMCRQRLAAPSRALSGLPEDMTSCRFLTGEEVGIESLDRLSGPMLAKHSAFTTSAFNLGRSLGILNALVKTQLSEAGYEKLRQDANDNLKGVGFLESFPVWSALSPDPPAAIGRLVDAVRATAAKRWSSTNDTPVQRPPPVGGPRDASTSEQR